MSIDFFIGLGCGLLIGVFGMFALIMFVYHRKQERAREEITKNFFESIQIQQKQGEQARVMN